MIYSFSVWGSKQHDVKIELTSLTGNADLFVKEINGYSSYEESITLEDIKNYYMDPKNQAKNFAGLSVNQQGVDIVKVKFDPKKCASPYIEPLNVIDAVCNFSIAVVGKAATATDKSAVTSLYSLH